MKFKEMALEALEADVPRIRGKVVIGGMGGSGIGGRIWSDLSNDEVLVVSDYKLPNFIDKKWKFIASSYSGNTEEVITLLKQALQRGLKSFVMTSGGKLRSMAKKNNLPLIKIPEGYQPRFAFPYSFFYLVKMLGTKKEIIKAKKDIEKMEEDWPRVRISGIPVVVGHTIYKSASYRIATQFNENAKIPAFHTEIPEMNHNLTTGLEKGRGKLHFILIRDKDEPSGIRERIEWMKENVLRKYKITEIWSKGSSNIGKVANVVYQGDMLSLHTAKILGEDPYEINAIKSLKEVLKKKGVLRKMVNLYVNKSKSQNREK